MNRVHFLISPHFLSFSGVVQRNVAVPGISGQLRAGKSTTKLESLHSRHSVFPGKSSFDQARKFKIRPSHSAHCRGHGNPRVTVFFRARSPRSSVKAHSSVGQGGKAARGRLLRPSPPILNQNEAIYPSHGLTCRYVTQGGGGIGARNRRFSQRIFPKKGGRSCSLEGEGGNIYTGGGRPAGRRSDSLTTLRHRSQSDFNPPRFKHLWPSPLVVGAARLSVLVHSPIVGDHDGD